VGGVESPWYGGLYKLSCGWSGVSVIGLLVLSPANQARQLSLFADEPACDPVYISTLAIDDQRERNQYQGKFSSF
jgi:hypothetical protein